MCTVAVVAHALIPGMPWPVAFVLGAIVSPTDALAPAEILRRLRVPRRLVSLVEGESLLNDGTALVAYNTALTAVGGDLRVPGSAGGLPGERRRRHRDRARGRQGAGGDPPPDQRHPDRDHDLAAQRLRGLPAGRAARTCPACSRRSRSASCWAGRRRRSRPRRCACRATRCGRSSSSSSTRCCSCSSASSSRSILEGLGDEPPVTLLGWAAAVSATVILTRLVLERGCSRASSARRPPGGAAGAPGVAGGCA